MTVFIIHGDPNSNNGDQISINAVPNSDDEARRFNVAAWNLNIKAPRFNDAAPNSDDEAPRFNVEALSLNIEAQRFNDEAWSLDDEAPNLF